MRLVKTILTILAAPLFILAAGYVKAKEVRDDE